MSDHSYSALLAAKRNGTLDAVLEPPLCEERYGPGPDELAESADLPRPEDLTDE